MADDNPKGGGYGGSGGHFHEAPLPIEDALENARQFALDHPQPPKATRTVDDYLAPPAGFQRWPDPPGWRKVRKRTRRRWPG